MGEQLQGVEFDEMAPEVQERREREWVHDEEEAWVMAEAMDPLMTERREVLQFGKLITAFIDESSIETTSSHVMGAKSELADSAKSIVDDIALGLKTDASERGEEAQWEFGFRRQKDELIEEIGGVEEAERFLGNFSLEKLQNEDLDAQVDILEGAIRNRNRIAEVLEITGSEMTVDTIHKETILSLYRHMTE